MQNLDTKLLDSYSDEQLLLFLQSHFRESVPKKIEQIKALAVSNEKKELQSLLHSLKNTFGNIGSESTAKFCQSIEDELDFSSCKSALNYIGILIESFHETDKEFSQYLEYRRTLTPEINQNPT